MGKIIYSKYSNDRSREYAIRTDIVNEDGGQAVYKRPIFPEGAEHVHKQAEYFRKNNLWYEEHGFALAECLEAQDGIRYEFVQGKQLSDEINSYVSDGDLLKAFGRLMPYIEQIKSFFGGHEFRYTEEFGRVFGIDADMAAVLSGLDSACNMNIDMIPENIFLDGNRKVVIDYEWTFDFLIPSEYAVYRFVKSCYESYGPDTLDAALDKCQIEPERTALYAKMELGFQNFVRNGRVTASELYTTIGKDNIALYDCIEAKKAEAYKDVVVVYFDKGDGFSEESKIEYYSPQEIYTLKVPEGTRTVRIDPCSRMCTLKEFTLNGQKYVEEGYLYRSDINFDGNAAIMGHKVYFFTDDPQIILDTKRYSIQEEISFSLSVEKVKDGEIDSLIKRQGQVSRLIDCISESRDKNLKLNIDEINVNIVGSVKEVSGRGWCLIMKDAVKFMEIKADDIYGDIKYGIERSDVASSFKKAVNADKSGFEFFIKFPLDYSSIKFLIASEKGISHIKKYDITC